MSGVNILHEIDISRLQDIQALAASVYSEDVVLPLVVLETWYKKNPNLWWVATVENKIVGYLCVMALTEEAFGYVLVTPFN